MRRFTATLDGLAKTLTFVVAMTLVIPFFTIATQYSRTSDAKLLIAPVIIIAAMITSLLYRPREYTLDAAGIHVIRTASSVTIPLQRIRSLMPVTVKELGFGLRTFGVGGFMGYFGKYWYRSFGHITLYVTDRSKMLMITLDNEQKILISPDDTPGFMAAFHELKR